MAAAPPTSTSCPPDLIRVLNSPRPSLFYAALPLPCVIVNANQRDKTNKKTEQNKTKKNRGRPGKEARELIRCDHAQTINHTHHYPTMKLQLSLPSMSSVPSNNNGDSFTSCLRDEKGRECGGLNPFV